jgi:hypothetical protein
MFGLAGRRVAEGIVALFALLGFAFVPLGKKTTLEHTIGIFTTPAAKDAWHELGAGVADLRERLVGAFASAAGGSAKAEPKPEVPELGRHPARKR